MSHVVGLQQALELVEEALVEEALVGEALVEEALVSSTSS